MSKGMLMSTSSPIQLSRTRPPPLTNTVHFFTEEQHHSPSSPNGSQEIFPNSSAYDNDDIVLTIYPLWKRNLYQLMEQPTSSRPAFIIHMFTTFLIVASAFVTVLETVPAFHSIPTSAWFGVESFLVALFTVEYIMRSLAWSNTWSTFFYWIFSFYGLIDLLSVLPYYIEVLLRQDTSVYFRFSILRMFRLLRVFRPFRYNHTILLTIEVMFLSVRRSQHALFAIGFFVMMILTVFSTLLYFAERGTWDEVLDGFVNVDGDPTNFSSIPAAAWFVLVTITTVGYGEITPRSFLGRLITLPLLVFGLLLITLPSFVLGREFSHVWERMNRDKEKEDDSLNLNNTSHTPGRTPMSPIPLQGPYSASQYPSHSHPSYNPSHNYASTTTTTTYNTAPYIHGSYPPQPPRSARPDLTNMKLAQNQTELSRQIDALGAVVEDQGRLIGRLVGLLEGRERGVGDDVRVKERGHERKERGHERKERGKERKERGHESEREVGASQDARGSAEGSSSARERDSVRMSGEGRRDGSTASGLSFRSSSYLNLHGPTRS